MMKTIREEVEKFERVLFKNFGLLNLSIFFASFIPYVYAFDTHYSVWQSFKEFSTIWKASSGIQFLYFLCFLLLVVSPICFLICTLIISSKTKQHEGSVIYQTFMRQELKEDQNFLGILFLWAYTAVFYLAVVSLSVVLLLVLIFSSKNQTLIPSFGFYFIFGIIVFWGYRLFKDFKQKFNFKLFIKRLDEEIYDEFSKLLRNWLEKVDWLYKIDKYSGQFFGDNLSGIEQHYSIQKPPPNRFDYSEELVFETPEKNVRIEKVKHIADRPKLRVRSGEGFMRKTTFTGYFFNEVKSEGTDSLYLTVENTGKGTMDLEITSDLPSVITVPQNLLIPEKGEKEVKLFCHPDYDPAFRQKCIQKGTLSFKFLYEHEIKIMQYAVRVTADGYSSNVIIKSILSGVLAVVFLSTLPSLLGKLIPNSWQSHIKLTTVSDIYGFSLIILASIGPIILSWFFGRVFFRLFPKKWSAVIVIPLFTITLCQGLVVALYKSDLIKKESHQSIVSETFATVSAAKGLIVRQSPSTSSGKLFTIAHNSQVKILSIEGDWAQIAFGSDFNQTGYVAKKYLGIIK